MQECYQFLQKYKGVDNFRVYGNTGYEYAYINETYPTHIDYKWNELVICNLDIEVESAHGFSEAKDALNEVQAITMKCSTDGIFHVFSCQPFDAVIYNEEHKDTEIQYHYCTDELDLFDKFLDLWETLEPDISAMTGGTSHCAFLLARLMPKPLTPLCGSCSIRQSVQR